MQKAADQIREMEAIWARADADGRELSPYERKDMEERLLRIKSAQQLEQFGGPMTAVGQGAFFTAMGDPGSRFIESDGYKSIRTGRGESFSSGLIEVGPALSAKGTLLEGTGAPGTGTAGGLLGAPQVVPGVVGKLFQPLTLEDLLLSGQATTNTVRYAVQGTATSGAAGVAEGGTKPESTLAFSTIDEPVKKVATSIVISDEALEDAPTVQQLINSQLGLFIRIEVERQLLRGAAGGNEIQGLLTSRGVPVYAGGTAVGNKAVQLFKAMNGMRGSAFVEPEWIAMNPTDWESIRLLTDTAGQYFGGGPFQGPYGSGQSISASGQLGGAADTLWNKPVYVTSALGAGTAVIGNSQSAQVWNRGGLRVEATNSHASNFVLDLTAIRAERRAALCVYRPNGFVEARIS
jgi:HK97 family phage major capsid protein